MRNTSDNPSDDDSQASLHKWHQHSSDTASERDRRATAVTTGNVEADSLTPGPQTPEPKTPQQPETEPESSATQTITWQRQENTTESDFHLLFQLVEGDSVAITVQRQTGGVTDHAPTEPELDIEESTQDKRKDLFEQTTRGEETGDRTPLKPISAHATGSDAADTASEPDLSTSNRTAMGDEVIADTCPECDGAVQNDGSDQYCTNCGLMISDRQIDTGPEWRAFDSKQRQNKSRVGSPTTNDIHDKGLSTVIGWDNKDANGTSLKQGKRQQMQRLRKWDQRYKVQDSQERNLKQALGEIQRICSEVNAPDYISEMASTIYRRALEDDLLPGRSIESVATASVFIAFRQADVPKTLNEVMEYSRVSRNRVTGAYSYIGRELGLEIEPPKVTQHIAPVTSELNLSDETAEQTREIIEEAMDKNLHSGKAPSGFVAAAAYAAAMITQKDPITQNDAADAGDVCELTIRSRHRELLDAVGYDRENLSPPTS